MDTKVLARMFLSFVENAPSVSKIDMSAIPAKDRAVLKSWLDGVNIPEDAESLFYEVKIDSELPVYVGRSSGDEPDPFLFVAIVQDGAVIGESVDVAS